MLFEDVPRHEPRRSSLPSWTRENRTHNAKCRTQNDSVEVCFNSAFCILTLAFGKVVRPGCLAVIEAAGAKCIEVTLPHTDYCVAVYYIVATAEASSNLARYDGVKYGYRAENARDLLEMYKKTRSEGFGAEVKRRIMLGTYALSSGYYDAYYKKASQVRARVKEDFDNAFKKCDVILTPTSPTPAFKLGEKTDDPLQMYLSDIYTISANLAGIPGISVPCGFSAQGLPIGVQFLAGHFAEGKLLQIAHAYEQHAAIEKRRPAL